MSQQPRTNMWYLENRDETLFIGTISENNTNNLKNWINTNINEQI